MTGSSPKGFAVFAVIFALRFWLLLVISLGGCVALGITFANETERTDHGENLLPANRLIISNLQSKPPRESIGRE